ncbi:hypothetical protein AVEN_40236-1 [Araneus ventricosus]|uniref:Uncharacterized protein n=1 Tax=Araneus ventricosus TaxID=182803 RepID=A0A4Y2N324_ARAVE|nr:hypothetical protein AVEN_40236-1 [Araneus ventricosus]
MTPLFTAKDKLPTCLGLGNKTGFVVSYKTAVPGPCTKTCRTFCHRKCGQHNQNISPGEARTSVLDRARSHPPTFRADLLWYFSKFLGILSNHPAYLFNPELHDQNLEFTPERRVVVESLHAGVKKGRNECAERLSTQKREFPLRNS